MTFSLITRQGWWVLSASWSPAPGCVPVWPGAVWPWSTSRTETRELLSWVCPAWWGWLGGGSCLGGWGSSPSSPRCQWDSGRGRTRHWQLSPECHLSPPCCGLDRMKCRRTSLQVPQQVLHIPALYRNCRTLRSLCHSDLNILFFSTHLLLWYVPREGCSRSEWTFCYLQHISCQAQPS